MRPPSIELLRALRAATLPFPVSSRTAVGRRLASTSSSSQLQRPRTFSARGLSTSVRQNATTPKGAVRNRAPKTHDRGPMSHEDTQTDFSKMDILASAGAQTPATNIDACTAGGFHLNNGTITTGGLGLFLLDGEAFVWTPWRTGEGSGGRKGGQQQSHQKGGGEGGFRDFLNARGVLDIPTSSLGVLELVHPKPDLLIVGTGRKLYMLSPSTRKYIYETLGIRVDVMDTANAAASYNLLATERGVQMVAALLIPDGFGGK